MSLLQKSHPVIPAQAGIRISLNMQQNGFPITTSGMTEKTAINDFRKRL